MKIQNDKIILTKEELPKKILELRKHIRERIFLKMKELYYAKYFLVLDKDLFSTAYKNLINDDSIFHNEIINNAQSCTAMIQCTGHYEPTNTDVDKNFIELYEDVYLELKDFIKKEYNCILSIDDYKKHKKIGFDIYTSEEVAKSIWNSCMQHHHKESASKSLSISPMLSKMITELTGTPLTQSKMNTIANLINKDAGTKLKFKVISIFPNSVHITIPKLTQEFIKRFIEGKEDFGNLISNSVITINLPTTLTANIDDANIIKNFFANLLKYCTNDIFEHAQVVYKCLASFDIHSRRLLAETKMGCMVSFVLSDVLTTFDEIDMKNNPFIINTNELKELMKFIKVSLNNKNNRRDKQNDILDTWRKMLDKNGGYGLGSVIRELSKFYKGEFDKEIQKFNDKLVSENSDTDIHERDKIYYEAFQVKKLKKLPRDIVTYIAIEAENIATANDKMMIASYCISKLEICEWYIALLESDSKKFIVPHDKPYLEWMRTELLKCYKMIMGTKVVNPNRRPILDIQYPKGYEG